MLQDFPLPFTIQFEVSKVIIDKSITFMVDDIAQNTDGAIKMCMNRFMTQIEPGMVEKRVVRSGIAMSQ